MDMWTSLVLPGFIMWVGIMLLLGRSLLTRETLDGHNTSSPSQSLSNITVLIPARNEAETLARVLVALEQQDTKLHVIVVDDESTDNTAEIATNTNLQNLQLIKGKTVPVGWSGKLWALEQGRQFVQTPLLLLLDADIELQAGIIASLNEKMQRDNYQFVSLMAQLQMKHFWEKLLIPAFIYFFRLLYPFSIANNPRFSKIAAAAGGCILLETRILKELDGFSCLKGALIDDCTLAKRVKTMGYNTWIGLTHSARSLRSYTRLSEIWNMVARTAFTQLRYSVILLLALSLIFIFGFIVPVLALIFPSTIAANIGLITLILMVLSYLPILNYYHRASIWASLMPLIGLMYLAMTWTSALRYWRGEKSNWKGRTYAK